MNETTQQTVTALARQEPALPVELGFEDSTSFEHMQRVAKMFAASELVPQNFRGAQGLPNVIIALEMAKRMSASALAVMQNIYMVYGKPSWSSQFVIACINTCGRFEPLRYEIAGEGDELFCAAWTVDKGVKLTPRKDSKPWTIKLVRESGLAPYEGPAVSIAMAKKEGWFTKNGSKWQSMPMLMLHYRAATLFGRLYAPELLMGMKTVEEVIDIEAETVKRPVMEGPAEPEQAITPEAVVAAAIDTTSKLPPYEQVMELIKASSNVTEDQVLAFAKETKLCKPETVELAQLADSKLRDLAKAWLTVLPKIQAIQI